MESVTQLAVHLDIAMLQAQGVAIADENVPDASLPLCNPAAQLGHRLLIKYVRQVEVEKYSAAHGVSHFSGPHWVTPTPMAAKDLISALTLPPPVKPCWTLLLQPAKLTSVYGPRRIAGGFGIEYILLDGFPSDALVDPPWCRQHK